MKYFIENENRFDRTLGGAEFTHRLVEHFAKIIKKEKGVDIYEYPKSLLKLHKEAERVKIVLSANTDHQAQIESLFDGYDFKSKITREQFEKLCKDLFDRIEKPINDAIKQSGVVLVSCVFFSFIISCLLET